MEPDIDLFLTQTASSAYNLFVSTTEATAQVQVTAEPEVCQHFIQWIIANVGDPMTGVMIDPPAQPFIISVHADDQNWDVRLFPVDVGQGTVTFSYTVAPEAP